MQLSECNPYLRAAQIQPAVLEGTRPRMAYDHRIFLILAGEGQIVIAGQSYPLEAHALVIFPPQTEYHFRGKLKVVVLNFDMTRACQSRRTPLTPVPCADYDEACCFDLTRADGLDAPMVLTADAMEQEIIMELVATFHARHPNSDARTSAELKRLLCDVLERRAPAQAHGVDLVDKILLYVRSNAAEIGDNDMIGKEFGYHPIYIASVVKKKTGKTLHRIILEERIRLSCRFLRATDNSVEQIAFDTGFSSRSHFCTVFKSMMDMTPTAYRAQR